MAPRVPREPEQEHREGGDHQRARQGGRRAEQPDRIHHPQGVAELQDDGDPRDVLEDDVREVLAAMEAEENEGTSGGTVPRED